MALPIKKMYVGSQYRTTESLSLTSLKLELLHSSFTPWDHIFGNNDICTSHAWQLVETMFNAVFYLLMRRFAAAWAYSKTIRLPNVNYTRYISGTRLEIILNEMIATRMIAHLETPYNLSEFTVGITNNNSIIE